jgi:hypothetical protein
MMLCITAATPNEKQRSQRTMIEVTGEWVRVSVSHGQNVKNEAMYAPGEPSMEPNRPLRRSTNYG